jgi:hypothetical protein
MLLSCPFAGGARPKPVALIASGISRAAMPKRSKELRPLSVEQR